MVSNNKVIQYLLLYRPTQLTYVCTYVKSILNLCSFHIYDLFVSTHFISLLIYFLI